MQNRTPQTQGMKAGTLGTSKPLTTMDEALAMAESLDLTLSALKSEPVKESKTEVYQEKTFVKEEVIDMQRVSSPVNDVQETIHSFLDKVVQAKALGQDFVETTPEIFNHYMRGQKSAYFWYDNVKVYKIGEREKLEQEDAKSTVSIR